MVGALAKYSKTKMSYVELSIKQVEISLFMKTTIVYAKNAEIYVTLYSYIEPNFTKMVY